MAETTKPTVTTTVKPKGEGNAIAFIAPILCILGGYLIWRFVLGAASGFKNPSTEGGFMEALKPSHKGPIGDWNKMYEGGIIVPVLIGLILMVLVFSIERYLTIKKAQGKASNAVFIKKVQMHLANKNVDAALAECDKQKGAVGNVMKAGLIRYKEMITDTTSSTDQKIIAIQKEVEEATALEMPMLQKNLVFLSTITSVATLIALLGTVLGMIKSFSALGDGGSGGAADLAVGISEALYNTATGIFGSAFAMIMYNIFTTKIDGITYGIDESGFTLTQSFASLYK